MISREEVQSFGPTCRLAERALGRPLVAHFASNWAACGPILVARCARV